MYIRRAITVSARVLLIGSWLAGMPAPAQDKKGSTLSEPTCVTWDGAWVAHRYSMERNEWSSWKSPPVKALGRHGGTWGVGDESLIVLDNSNYSGWRFDFGQKAWSEVPAAAIHGPSFVPCSLHNGFVDNWLVIWGHCLGPPHGAVLDTNDLTWKPIIHAPIAPRYRSINAIIGKKLLIWGGYPNAMQDGAVFDVSTKKWEMMPAAPIEFKYGMGWAVWRNRLAILGGTQSRAGAIYDVVARTWEKMEPAPFDVSSMPACAVSGDKLFLWSVYEKTGSGALYDLSKREWKPLPAAPLAPRCLSFAHAIGPKVVVWGGWASDGNSWGRFCRDAAIFDVNRGEWQRIADLPGDLPSSLHPGW